VTIAELLIGFLLICCLLGLAGYFAWQQFVVRRGLALDRTLLAEERRYLIWQTRRRLICSVLMFLLAGFLVGWYFIDRNLPELQALAAAEPGKTHPLLELVAFYWAAALLNLFTIIILAAMDFFATARHGMHQRKLLEIERRTTLEMEAARLRSQK
jgi:hypothetical protein